MIAVAGDDVARGRVDATDRIVGSVLDLDAGLSVADGHTASRVDTDEVARHGVGGTVDTVADNASSGMFMLGSQRVDPAKVDFYTCGMVFEKNGTVVSTGAGAAAMGSPVNCVAWLANTLGRFEIPLKAGEVILSGSLIPLEPVVAGDEVKVHIGGIGSASLRFC